MTAMYHASRLPAASKDYAGSRIGRVFCISAIALTSAFSLAAEEAASPPSTLSPDQEAVVRLQVFLDRAEFAPGRIDGRHGDFTLRALELYREANGLPAPASEDRPSESNGATSGRAPVVSDLDLASVNPLFVDYTITGEDLENVGDLPDSVEAQSKLKTMPYRSVGEAVAERFHMDLNFLEELNPGQISSLKAGDSVKVPNVEPFDLAAFKSQNAAKKKGETSMKTGNMPQAEDESAESVMSVKIDTKTNMLSLFENDQLIAAYPVTIGSNQTESPIGDWKITGVAKMPDFRHDKAMLERGERSSNFHILPPGPNSPVGVIWIQLDKKGIGLHGTSSPDTIGRAESHGCVRLANWDVTRLAAKVQAGVSVNIH